MYDQVTVIHRYNVQYKKLTVQIFFDLYCFNFTLIIFNCPSLFPNRQLFFSFLLFLGYHSPDSNLL